jgi:FMN phosphatase YigB (HAD superfamily)
MKTKISLVITDLDNTIYDWISAFVPALYEMVGEASKLLGVSEDVLLDNLKEVHQRHGNSEHPFALLETNVVNAFHQDHPESNPKAILDPAFHAFNRVRKSTLELYDGVLPTLQLLQQLSIPVVAYTDAFVANSLFRLERLNIKSYFSALYAPNHQGQLGSSSAADFVQLLNPRDRKPNPKTLLDICSRFSIAPEQTLYIGDSIARDVYMALSARVNAAWAEYGTVYDHTLWPRLVRVTHWTQAEVEKENQLKEKTRDVRADVILNKFDSILEAYEFAGKETGSKARILLDNN